MGSAYIHADSPVLGDANWSYSAEELPESVLSTLVSALVPLHVRYCPTVYGSVCVKDLKIFLFSAMVISG